MTREERNNRLKHLITCMKCEARGNCCDENCPTQYVAGNKGEIIKNLEEISKILEQEPCGDTVSRKKVLNTLFYNSDNNCEVVLNKELQDRIKSLPPVTPIQRWIPVSERLPEDGRPVLIYAWNVHHVVARYASFRTENGYKKCWVTADAWNGNTEIKHNVIAWMPLPRPYNVNKP